MQSVENLTEIIQQVVQEEEQPKPEPEPEPVKKKRVPTEKQLAALAKGRETRARNKAEKDRMKNVKLKMLEKIHDRVESFDMNALIRKMDEIIYKPPPTPKLEKPKKKIVVEEPPEIEPPRRRARAPPVPRANVPSSRWPTAPPAAAAPATRARAAPGAGTAPPARPATR